MTDKHAVVLSGGGAYGAYQLGCLRALFEGRSPSTRGQAVDPAVLTGTSAGALNAALLLSNETATLKEALEYLDDIWFHKLADTGLACGSGALRFRGDPLEFFRASCWKDPVRTASEIAADANFLAQDFFRRGVNFLKSDLDWEQRVLELVNLQSFVSAPRFDQLIRKYVRLDAIRRSPRQLRIVTTNWNTGGLRVFGNSDMTDAIGHNVIRGSGALPGVLPPVEIERQSYADGGLVMNTPLEPAITAGATVIHVIYMDPLAADIPVPPVPNTLDTIYRSYIVSMAATLSRDMEIARQINVGLKALREKAVWDQMGWSRSLLRTPVTPTHGDKPESPHGSHEDALHTREGIHTLRSHAAPRAKR